MCKLYKYNEFRNASYLVSFIICQYAIVNSYQSLSFIYLLFRTKFSHYCSLIKLDILCLFFKMYLNFILEINFFNAITPFSSGGQPFELYCLKKEKIKMADATTIVIEQFVVYQIALVILGVVAILCNSIFHIFTNNTLLKNKYRKNLNTAC